MHTMTKKQGKSGTIDVKALLAQDEEFLRALVRTALQEVLEAEMTEALGAEKGERAAGRQALAHWPAAARRRRLRRPSRLPSCPPHGWTHQPSGAGCRPRNGPSCGCRNIQAKV